MFESISRKHGVRKYIGPKRLILFLIYIAVIAFVWKYYQEGLLTPQIIVKYSYDNPLLVILLFELIYIIGVIAALPCLPLNLVAGFLWGGICGGIYTTVAVTIGGWISFLIARRLIGKVLTEKFQNKWMVIIQKEFEENGWKFVAFMRINPIIPTGPLNYMLGLTSLSNSVFLLTTFIFLLFPSVVVAYIGYTLQTFMAEQADVADILRAVLVVSGSLTFLAIIKLSSTIYKKRKLTK
jgi:uncharacterized membrane protein YdjX (TVP38/TMEM64 family)